MRLCLISLMFVIIAIPAPSMAQESEAEPEAAVEAQESSDDGYDERLALAKKLHELRPVREQVDAGINQFAQTRPENEREGFKTAMRSAFNINALEKISLNAYAETFTSEELRVLIEYHSNPVAVSAAEKMNEYSGIVYPELVKMLDKAAIQARTGQ